MYFTNKTKNSSEIQLKQQKFVKSNNFMLHMEIVLLLFVLMSVIASRRKMVSRATTAALTAAAAAYCTLESK
jgi:hypothetical protein